ncbi:MAG: primosomal protein N' [Candidatus Omnitrophica bacterium]|nr:primosomal protein N' [Candidatus Omnitrophota bacterium]MDD5652661.1 primosomal protein N' [Candidatus Omnitrophota bacterium]
MLYAKVVLGLAVEGPFDYLVPEEFKGTIAPGKRVRVNFAHQRKIGFCVAVTSKSKIKYHKPILEVLDELPILGSSMLLLTQRMADYYCCFWGEAIETALPEGIRNGRKLKLCDYSRQGRIEQKAQTVLLHDLDSTQRWEFYCGKIKKILEIKRKVIVIVPDVPALLRAKKKIEAVLKADICLLYRHARGENELWEKIFSAKVDIVIGTRSAIFAPLPDLGLIIIDAEEDHVYKQDQVPHYHAREIGLMRSEIENVDLVLGSATPSLEAFFLAKNGAIGYLPLARKSNFPEIRFVDTANLSFAERKKGGNISRLLEDAVFSVLTEKGKSLLFMNRKGYSGAAACMQCNALLKCPRCSINLVYHFHENTLKCHYCNFKMDAPKICPVCNSGYIKFSGAGTEKIENELLRIFPQAKITLLESDRQANLKDYDIFVATSAVLKQEGLQFDLVGALAVDNALNFPQLRSAENAFRLVWGLANLTEGKLIIQTAFVTHPVFQSLWKKDQLFFYNHELEQRKQLKFPPFGHFVLIKLRGKNEEKVKASAGALSEQLIAALPKKNYKFLSSNPAVPNKLRGNFYWEIIGVSCEPQKLSPGLKKELKKFAHSGIIITVDVDPI